MRPRPYRLRLPRDVVMLLRTPALVTNAANFSLFMASRCRGRGAVLAVRMTSLEPRMPVREANVAARMAVSLPPLPTLGGVGPRCRDELRCMGDALRCMGDDRSSATSDPMPHALTL